MPGVPPNALGLLKKFGRSILGRKKKEKKTDTATQPEGTTAPPLAVAPVAAAGAAATVPIAAAPPPTEPTATTEVRGLIRTLPKVNAPTGATAGVEQHPPVPNAGPPAATELEAVTKEDAEASKTETAPVAGESSNVETVAPGYAAAAPAPAVEQK
ncbi:hypothetical protein B9Z19DRAFT_1067473 [Tuber borchii]|uniref:Uncharacterized protein n=1 Tax=Tuber borchii TaxID=42251 RepID=A0A2T6ZIQ9_TUBBO|nr:hypothetical protein B9Z19DRAFT_1067473 [Tuber borchii]